MTPPRVRLTRVFGRMSAFLEKHSGVNSNAPAERLERAGSTAHELPSETG
jgi:hypothetical protein